MTSRLAANKRGISRECVDAAIDAAVEQAHQSIIQRMANIQRAVHACADFMQRDAEISAAYPEMKRDIQ